MTDNETNTSQCKNNNNVSYIINRQCVDRKNMVGFLDLFGKSTKMAYSMKTKSAVVLNATNVRKTSWINPTELFLNIVIEP